MVGVLGALILGAATTSGAATPAVGTIAPAGPITIKVSAGVFHLSVSGVVNDVGTMVGTLEGSVDADGNMTFAKANVSLPEFPTNVILPADITPVVLGDWHGTIDPAKGTISISGPMELDLDAPGSPITGCPLGPFTFHAQGSKYKSTTGGADIGDPAFAIPAVPPATPGCGGAEDTLSEALGLPGRGGVNMHIAITPVLTGSGTPPPSTTTLPPTTQAPTTTVAPATTVGAPVATVAATADTLPRHGRSRQSTRAARRGVPGRRHRARVVPTAGRSSLIAGTTAVQLREVARHAHVCSRRSIGSSRPGTTSW